MNDKHAEHLKMPGSICLCGHAKDLHADIGWEREECGMEGCDCKNYDGVAFECSCPEENL